MSEQTNMFDFLDSQAEEEKLLSTGSRVLEEKGFTYLSPISVNTDGAMAFRSIFEDKPCTVQIDKEGHIMFKHDDSAFYDYFGGV